MSKALWSGPALGGKATKKSLAPEHHALHVYTTGLDEKSICELAFLQEFAG